MMLKEVPTQKQAIKVRYEKAFHDRYFWYCPHCNAENRYFEFDCPYCLHEALNS